MRLLLDEHLSPEIARQLRARGHDVVAVREHPELRGRADRVHFVSMAAERRVIVTRDLGDFRPLLQQAMQSGEQTYGLICVSRRISLSRKNIGALVEQLEQLLQANPDDDSITRQGGEIWL